MRSPKIAPSVGLCLLIAAPALAVVASDALADSREMFGFLSQPMLGGAAVASGATLYHLGGHDPVFPLKSVEAFDALGRRSALPPLPFELAESALAFDGRYAYLAGGNPLGPSDRSDQVIRFDTATGQSTTLPVRLAEASLGASAVWANGRMFLFGGHAENGCSQIIQRLDPTVPEVQVMSSRFPFPVCWNSAVWTGEKAYILGGLYGPQRRVFEYDPVSDALRDLGNLLPHASYFTTAAWTGDVALLVGMETEGGPSDLIVKLDPASREATVMRQTLPTPRSLGASAWLDGRLFFLGGWGPVAGDPRAYSNQVVAFEFLPAAPTLVAAVPGPEPGSVALSWTLPDPATYTKLQRVVVQRSTIEDASPAQSVTFAISLGESFVDHDLIPGIRYYYRIAGETREGRGAWSEEADSRAAILPASPSILGQRPLADADGDGVVDAVEGNVCDGNVIEDIINAFGDENPYAGRCGNGDYDATAYADDDRDGIPDRAERVLCVALENGDLQRGVCNAAESDYGAPPIAWSSLVAPPPLP